MHLLLATTQRKVQAPEVSDNQVIA
jgi:hypothetical protein